MNWLMPCDKRSSLTSDSEEVRTFEGMFFSGLAGVLLYGLAVLGWYLL